MAVASPDRVRLRFVPLRDTFWLETDEVRVGPGDAVVTHDVHGPAFRVQVSGPGNAEWVRLCVCPLRDGSGRGALDPVAVVVIPGDRVTVSDTDGEMLRIDVLPLEEKS